MESLVAAPLLLVEDDANDVLLIRRAFQKAGVANPLHVASDGEAAMAYLSALDEGGARAADALPVLVLLDLKLPRRTGLDVLEWLRGRERLRRLPVVVLTSSREAADLTKAYDLGANSYLVKPVNFDALLRLVQTLNLSWLLLADRPVGSDPPVGSGLETPHFSRSDPGHGVRS